MMISSVDNANTFVVNICNAGVLCVGVSPTVALQCITIEPRFVASKRLNTRRNIKET